MAFRFLLAVLALSTCLGAPIAEAKTKASTTSSIKLDLADKASGIFRGDVISDARGSSRSGVTLTVKKVGPNTVEVSSDYGRLPTFRVKLTKAMQTIQQASGDTVFLLDLSKSPEGLMVTVDDASWAGERRP